MILKWLCLFTLFSSRLAWALDLTEFGAINVSYPYLQSDSDPSLQTSVGFSWGGGISLGISVHERIQIEPALIYIPRSYSFTSANAPRISHSFATIQFPVLVRYWFTDSISGGIGPYIAHGSGNVSMEIGGQPTSQGFGDIQYALDDVGFVLSFRYRTQITDLVGFVLDQRLVVGTSNLDLSGSRTAEFRDLQSWFGIAFVL